MDGERSGWRTEQEEMEGGVSSGWGWQSWQSRGSWCGWRLQQQTWTGTEAEAASAEPNSQRGQRKKALLLYLCKDSSDCC